MERKRVGAAAAERTAAEAAQALLAALGRKLAGTPLRDAANAFTLVFGALAALPPDDTSLSALGIMSAGSAGFNVVATLRRFIASHLGLWEPRCVSDRRHVPAAEAAVCAGNVLTSMRITDVVLKAFGACAASQGCMNNFTFGDASFGYYETIAGGSGAGPDWDGTDAVQCHMTNTRMTDVEVMEKSYPVLVREFSVRRGSGGNGRHRGGAGVVREVTTSDETPRPYTLRTPTRPLPDPYPTPT